MGFLVFLLGVSKALFRLFFMRLGSKGNSAVSQRVVCFKQALAFFKVFQSCSFKGHHSMRHHLLSFFKACLRIPILYQGLVKDSHPFVKACLRIPIPFC